MFSSRGARLKRVLMTTDTVGGVWNYSLQLAEALAQFDIEIVLASMGPLLSPAQRLQVDQAENVTLFESNYKLEWMPQPWDDVEQAGHWLLEIEAETNPDIIHLNGYVHAALTWTAPVLVVGHSCVYSWFKSVYNDQPPADCKPYREKVTRGLNSADLVTAPSRWMLAMLKQYYGWFNSAEPVYNGRKAVPVPDDKKEFMVLTAGRLWDQGKNIAALDRCADLINCPIYVAGQNDSPSDGGHNDFPKLKPLGFLDSPQLSDWMRRAAVFALPAKYEPFGLCPLEAALNSCVLILGDIPSLREIWEDAALYVTPDDDHAIAALINELQTNQNLIHKYAQRARQKAESFCVERMAAAYLELYRDLTKSSLDLEPLRI